MYYRFTMKNTLSRLLREVVKVDNIPNITISGISTNSVNINPGELYIAIKGNKFDAVSYTHLTLPTICSV